MSGTTDATGAGGLAGRVLGWWNGEEASANTSTDTSASNSGANSLNTTPSSSKTVHSSTACPVPACKKHETSPGSGYSQSTISSSTEAPQTGWLAGWLGGGGSSSESADNTQYCQPATAAPKKGALPNRKK